MLLTMALTNMMELQGAYELWVCDNVYGVCVSLCVHECVCEHAIRGSSI